MKRISSQWTFFYKRIFPLFWFGFLALFVVAALVGERSSRSVPVAFMIFPIVMAGFGYLIFRHLVFDLSDEVWDEGHELLVRNAGTEERIALKNIVNVGYSTMTRPERVTLTLREPGLMGKEITFSPPSRLLPFSRSPIIGELIERVDRARQSSP